MSEDWLGRWSEGRTGWHEPAGNDGLKRYWPKSTQPGSVLVPLCGKTPDLLWLANCGHDVVGVELSEVAVQSFFDEHDLSYERSAHGALTRYAAKDHALALFCGDYFEFLSERFDGLYDRGALVALDENLRPRYAEHTERLLKPDATRMIVTLEYDQRVVSGPPWSVLNGEMTGYWDDLVKVGEKDDIDSCPPKFRRAGLTDIREVFWLSRKHSGCVGYSVTEY